MTDKTTPQPDDATASVYVPFREIAKGEVFRTREVEEGWTDVHIDYDRSAVPIGVELLNAHSVEIDGHPARSSKLECPAEMCAYSFVGQGAERELVGHYVEHHSAGLLSDGRDREAEECDLNGFTFADHKRFNAAVVAERNAARAEAAKWEAAARVVAEERDAAQAEIRRRDRAELSAASPSPQAEEEWPNLGKLPTLDQLRRYMTATGWEPQCSIHGHITGGTAGVLWSKDSMRIGVPHEPDQFVIRGVVERLGWHENRPPRVVAASIRTTVASKDGTAGEGEHRG